MNTRTLRLLPAAGLAAAAVLGATAVPAHAAEPASLSIKGDLEILPGVHLLNIDATGTRDDAG
ncbi:MAG: hypothetical protein WBF94_01495, partial [Gordonia sp. (in: high G+C Gram-positive bacteria)]